MKKIIFLIIWALGYITTLSAQCTSLFSFAAYFETVKFMNQSSVPNAHFFWNFGDGTGSKFQNPIHKFPETGNYLVTLFAKDSVSNCASYYEYWVNVTKYSTDICQSSITDSIFFYNNDYYLKIIDHSTNCNSYINDYDGGPAQNFPPNNWIWLGGGFQHGRFLSRVQYYTYDTVNNLVIHREAYKTSPWLYTSSKNYGDCSANFEFTTVSQDAGGQRILFTAMNKSATFYEWEIAGFGNPVVSNNDSISHYYPYNTNFWLVGLKTIGAGGCKDTLYQNILVQENTQTTVSVNDLINSTACKLFPNPFTDQTTASFPSLKDNAKFTLYNSNGKLLKTTNNITEGKLTIYRDDLPSGIYFYVLQTDENIISTGKLVAE